MPVPWILFIKLTIKITINSKMHKKKATSPNFLDCVSSRQLLLALNTLKGMNGNQSIPQDLQLSFSQSSHSFFNTNSNNHIDFELYMAIKNMNEEKKGRKQKCKTGNAEAEGVGEKSKSRSKGKGRENRDKSKSRANKQNHKQIETIIENKKNNRSLTPLQKQNAVCEFKSRSHSRMQAQTEEGNKASKLKLGKSPKGNRNKQNFPQIQKVASPTATVSTTNKSKISEMSQRILQNKEKNGVVYIPIQNRMGQLLKQKQQKIAKIQRMNVTQKELQQRQCTFKPTINPKKKTTKQGSQFPYRNRHCTMHQLDNSMITSSKQFKQVKQVKQMKQMKQMKQVKQIKQKSRGNQLKPADDDEKSENRSAHRHKNAKFNLLLDLIH